MKEIEITTKIKEVSPAELPESDRKLIEEARQATRRSYAPYSKFHVGAAIELANGAIVTGNNQENAAFSSGTCAERSACFYASSQFPGVPMKKIAIAAWTDAHLGQEHVDAATATDNDWEKCFQALPISPCGACRQALLEYENKYGAIEVILYGREKTYVLPSVASLLPLCFTEF